MIVEINYFSGWVGGWLAGWLAGWLEKLELRLNSASIEVEIELN